MYLRLLSIIKSKTTVRLAVGVILYLRKKKLSTEKVAFKMAWNVNR